MSHSGSVVIVTGSGQGIGKAVAGMYAREGSHVIVAELHEETGSQTAEEIRIKGGQALFILCDVRDPESISNLMHMTYDRYHRIDVLINNAGIMTRRSPYELDVQAWDTVINTNLRGTFLCSREAARYMRPHGGGAVVNIASTRAFMSEPDTEAYAASKGGILALTHAMALSLANDHIRVNAISPGWIETGDYNQLRGIDHNQHPSGRVGKPADVARACLFLTDPANDFITGENLTIDGGMTRKMIYEP